MFYADYRVVARNVAGAGIRRVGSGVTLRDQGSKVMGSKSSSCLRDRRSGCTIFVELGTKICYVSESSKDQKFGYKDGHSN